MRKVLKWIGIVLGSLVGLILVLVLILSTMSNARLNKTYDIQPAAVAIPADDASLAEGQRLANIYCGGCHAKDYSGTDFFNEPALAIVDAPNLTSGEGGIGGKYSDEDWVLAIRHGVDSQGKPLFIMPSKDFYYFSDEDLGQIIAYLKTVPPADNDANDFSMGLMGRILLAMGALGDVLNAERIAHDAPRPDTPESGVTAAYGEYLTQTFGCNTCHGAQLSGGQGPEPGSPPGPNLTPGGNLTAWSEADFIHQARNRKSEWMPFESLAKMSDEELAALFLYLQSLPELETTTK
jgi:mono/diheme cytochrome c family protein